MIGQTIAHYKVTSKLGAGGMGEVYRATDSKLGRDVALKVLPEAFAQDTQRMQRFQREAQVLASLNHPNIAAIYGLEQQAHIQALAMELVEGVTLAERIAGGAFSPEEALPIARQIAEALEYAHEKGIIHRDLKPANIKVTPEGQVKVLDFGLAKALSDDTTARDISNSPTLTVAATRAGIVLGTASYMSPEQAKGKSVDRRADIWSFGVVLFEMLTGGQMYSGETAAETMAAVIKDEPAWDKLPASTPQHLRELLRRCLTRDARHRLQSIGDARIAIEETIADPLATAHASQTGAMRVVAASAWRRALPWALAGLLAVALGASLWRGGAGEPSGARAVSRFAIAIPDNETLALATSPAVAISADGTKLVYAARLEGTVKLFLRPVDRLEATPIPGTDNASAPFFSPDGNWVAFFAEFKLKKVPLQGGPVVILANVADHRGGTWAGDTIVYTPNALGGIYRIPAGGGAPQPVTQLDESRRERTHRFPRFLPDGQTVLFTVGTQQSPDYYDNARIDCVRLDTGERHTLFEGASTAAYLSSGHLLVARSASLFALPFDLRNRKITGPEATVLQGVAGDVTTGAVHFSVSNNGSLSYVPGSQNAGDILARMDRSGRIETLPAPRRTYLELSLSPDGRRAALTIGTINEYDIWVYDLARSTLSRLTFGGVNRSPKWSADGRRVYYSNVATSGQSSLYSKAADGSGSATLVRKFGLASTERVFVDDVSPDGKTIAMVGGLLSSVVGGPSTDISLISADGQGEARPFAADPRFDELGTAFSPDNRWVAYASSESGRLEVYVRAFAESGGKWQVSTSGGEAPRWSRTGKELFYHVGNRMMVVPVQTAPGFQAGTPQPLFDNYFDLRTDAGSVYDVSPDGKWFIAVRPANEQALARQLHVVLNWFEEVKRATAGTK